MDIETHKMGSRIAGDIISIFKREFGENEDKVGEDQPDDQEDDPENDTMVIIMEDEGNESANPKVTCIKV